MKTRKALIFSASAAFLLSFTLATTGCSSMSTRERNTAVGAGLGAVGGAVLTGGSTAGTLGGAAVGGVIGNQTSK